MRVSCSNNRITAYCGWVIARAIALLVVFAAAVSGTGAEAFAEIAGEDALYSSTWHYLFEDALTTNGVVQCICSTPDYLITIETSARGLTYKGERTIYTVDNGEYPVNTYTMDMELYTGNGNGDRPLSENGDRPLSENGNTAEEPLTIGGTVSAGSRQVVGGTNYTVTFEPDPGYKVATAYLDITPLELPEGANRFFL